MRSSIASSSHDGALDPRGFVREIFFAHVTHAHPAEVWYGKTLRNF